MADMHTPLKPCPFCGGQKIKFKVRGQERFFRCEDCFAQGAQETESGDLPYGEEIASAWNRRAPSQDAETVKALRRPGTMVLLDGRNEHGSHVIPMLPTNLPPEFEEDVGEVAEEIIKAAEALGFEIGNVVWTEWRWNEAQTGEFGRVEFDGYWEFVCVNADVTRALAGSAS